MALLEARELMILRGEEPLFANVSLSVEPAEILQIEGRNGSGKTTLLRVLCGLLQSDDGEVLWKGDSLRAGQHDFREQTLYLGHKAGIKLELTPTENLAVFLATNDGLSADAAAYPTTAASDVGHQEIEVALARSGIGHRAHLPCGVLSAGQRRRVALARLHLSQATLWVLDEPLTSLDEEGREVVRSTLDAHVKRGGSVIFSTHQAMAIDGSPPRTYRL